MYIFYYVCTTFPSPPPPPPPPTPFNPPLPSPPHHSPPPPPSTPPSPYPPPPPSPPHPPTPWHYSCSTSLRRFDIIRYHRIAADGCNTCTTGSACIATSNMSHHIQPRQARPLAGRLQWWPVGCQPYHPHPTLLRSLQPVGRSNYFMRLTAFYIICLHK